MTVARAAVARTDDAAFLGVEDTLDLLGHCSERLLALVRTAAASALDTPDTALKLLLGKVTHQLALLARDVSARLAELGDGPSLDGNWASPATPCPFAAGALVEQASGLPADTRAQALLRVALPRLADGIAASAPRVNRHWDEPTHLLLLDVAGRLADLADVAERFFAGSDDTVATAWRGSTLPIAKLRSLLDESPARALVLARPDRPARDGIFSLDQASRPAVPAAPGTVEALVFLLHHFAFSIELVALELCAEAIRDHAEQLPVEFTVAMARQCSDEARHTDALCTRIAELGGQLGMYPIHDRIWMMSRGRDLALRLAINQRVGEWLGVESLLRQSGRLRARGDDETASLFDFMVQDEITHVALGNRWLRHLCPGPDEVAAVHAAADAVRGEFGELTSENDELPITEWACRLAGFSTDEISRLAATRHRP